MEKITNSKVLKLSKNSGQSECIEFLKSQRSLETNQLASSEAYRKSICKLAKQELSLRKSKHKQGGHLKHNNFLSELYNHPKCLPQACHKKITSDESLNLNASLVHEKDKNLKLSESVEEGENKIKILESNLQVTEEKLKSSKTKVKRVAAREDYANKKVKKLEEKVTGACCEENINRIKELEAQLDRKNQEIKDLTENCEYLSDLLNDIDIKDRILNVFDEKSRTYTHSLKTCVYELLTHNVSASKVSSVISTVLKLVSVVANKLPCRSTVLQMNIQRLDLAQTQLCEVFSAKENTTLMTDETSKFGSKYMGYEAADEDGNLWVLGLREIETKSADHTLKVFKQILGDLDEKCGDNSVSKDVVTHIIATMSDRAATELKFNDLLKSFRKEILPLTYRNYETFSEDEKKNVDHLCNFFCGLHSLVNFAENARKCTKEVELGIFDGQIPISDPTYKDNDSGTCRVIRATTKAFGEGSGGDEKSGAQGKFKIYIKEFLHEKGLRNVPLRSYKGTRFNVLYENAASVFFLYNHIKGFLQAYGAENRLLKSIQHDLETVEFVAGVKALGLLSKFITCPLWNVLENEEIKIIQMNEKYEKLKTTLEFSSKNINEFMKGEIMVFGEDTYIEKGPIYESLIADNDFDDKVELFLEVLLPAMAQLCQKLYKDHLPGGAHTTLPTETVKKLTGTPKTSCFAESIFGQLDQLVRVKPNLSTLAAEAAIMFVNNQTLQWLESKDDTEKKELIRNASKNVKKLKKGFKARLSEIEANRYVAMQEKIKQREKLAKAKLKKQENYTTDILHHGLWQGATEVENMVMSYEKETEKIKALKAQLRFRKEVLKQKPTEKGMFNFTKQLAGQSRKELTVDELKANLKNLVLQAVVQDIENQTEAHMLVGKRVRHRFQNGENEDTWYSGKVISQVPSFPDWFNIIYDGDPAVYTYHNLPKDQDLNDLKILVN